MIKIASPLKKLLLVALSMSVAAPSALALPCNTLMAETSAPAKGADSAQNKANEKIVKIIEEIHAKNTLVDARLAPQLDPFFAEDTLEGMQRVYKRLSIRKNSDGSIAEFPDENGRLTTDTPAEQMRKFLNRNIGVKHTALDERLVKLVIEDANQVISDPESTRVALYSVAMALRLADEYARRLFVPEKEVDRDGKPIEKEEEKKKEEKKQDKDDKKDQEKKEKKKAKPQYPKLPKNYSPHTKDTKKQSGAGEEEEKYIAAEFNRTHLYYKLYNFNTVLRGVKEAFRSTPIPGLSTAVPEFENTEYKLTINMAGERKVDLFHVPGFDALQPADPRAKLTLDRDGHYVLETDLPTVTIPLRPAVAQNLSPEMTDFFTRTVGFKEAEFPELMRVELFDQLKGKSPQEISRKVEEYIRTKFLYSVSEKQETDPVEAVKARAFQCDMAAYLMVGILRDIFRVPSRAIGGFRAKKRKGASGDTTYLTVPGEGHAWVEVFINGRWITYDPTPIKKDEKEDQKGGGGDNEFQDIADPSIPPQDDQDKKDGEGDGQGQSSSKSSNEKKGKSVQDHKKEIEKNTNKTIDEWEKSAKGQDQEGQGEGKDGKDQNGKPSKSKGGQGGGAGKQPGSRDSGEGGDDGESKGSDGKKSHDNDGKSKDGETGKDGKGEHGKGDGKGDDLDQDDLIRTLEIGSLSLKNESKRNPFVDRSYRVLLQDALKPSYTRSENLERISRIGPYLTDSRFAKLINMAKDAVKVFTKTAGGSVVDMVEDLRSRFRNQDINVTYERLHGIIRHLELFSETLDPERGVRPPQELLATLKDMRKELYKLNGADSGDILAVREFLKTLPPISRSIIRDQYGLGEVGRNAATNRVASDLRNGKLHDFQLISTLSPYTNFILDAEPKPEYITAKTYIQDRRRVRGRDMVATEKVNDYYKSMRMQPNKSYSQNMREGTLFTPKKRLETLIPKSYGNTDDTERITIINYDTSGSMDGEPGEFQAGLIAAFVDNALSDVSASGRHRHKAMVMGFDTTVHTKMSVTSSAEAKNLIRSYRKKMKNTGGGTDIQATLIESFKAIADAQKRAGEPLRKANIIVMTDGQATLDIEELRRYRNAIDRRTPVEIMFVAINQTSPELMQFAVESGKAGLNKGFYREFTNEQINELINESQKVEVQDKDEAFNTEKKADQIPPHINALMDLAASQARAYMGHLLAAPSVQDPAAWTSYLQAMRQPVQVEIKRPIEGWMTAYRGVLFSHTTFKDRRLLNLVVDDFMKSFQKLTGVNFEALSHKEMENIRHLLRESTLQRK